MHLTPRFPSPASDSSHPPSSLSINNIEPCTLTTPKGEHYDLRGLHRKGTFWNDTWLEGGD